MYVYEEAVMLLQSSKPHLSKVQSCILQIGVMIITSKWKKMHFWRKKKFSFSFLQMKQWVKTKVPDIPGIVRKKVYHCIGIVMLENKTKVNFALHFRNT